MSKKSARKTKDSNRARKFGRKIPRQEIPTPRGRPYVPIHRSYTPELLANGRRRYEETPEPVAAIAVDFRIHAGSLRRLAGLLGWVRFAMGPRDLPSASRLLAQAEGLERRTLSGDRHPEARAEGAPQRMDGQNLEDLGRRPSRLAEPVIGPAQAGRTRWLAPQGDGESPTPEGFAASIDHLEREVRAELASVTALREQLKGLPRRPRDGESTARTLSTLSEVLQKIHRMRCGLTSPDTDDDDLPADLDAFRNELARRIRAFIASRTDRGDAGGDAARPVAAV